MRKEELMMQYRLQGMEYALRIAREKGLDQLEKEIKARGWVGVVMPYQEKESLLYEERVKERLEQTILTLSLSVLRDEFGFGEKRLNQFKDRFGSITGSLAEGYCSWMDYCEMLKEEANIEVDLADLLKGDENV